MGVCCSARPRPVTRVEVNTSAYEKREKELIAHTRLLEEQLAHEYAELRDAKNHLFLEKEFNDKARALQEQLAVIQTDYHEASEALVNEKALSEQLRSHRSAPSVSRSQELRPSSSRGSLHATELLRRDAPPLRDATNWVARSGAQALPQSKDAEVDEHIRPLRDQLAATSAELDQVKAQVQKDRDFHAKVKALQEQIATLRLEPKPSLQRQHEVFSQMRPLQEALWQTRTELDQMRSKVQQERDLEEQVRALRDQIAALQAEPPTTTAVPAARVEAPVIPVIRPLQEQLTAARRDLGDASNQMRRDNGFQDMMRVMQEQIATIQNRAMTPTYTPWSPSVSSILPRELEASTISVPEGLQPHQVECLLADMQEQPTNVGVQMRSCSALRTLLTSNPENVARVVHRNGVELLLQAMRQHKLAAVVQDSACWTLATLAADPAGRAKVVELGGLQLILEAMQTHRTVTGLQERGCLALRQLLDGAQTRTLVLQHGAVELVLAAMQHHKAVRVQEEAVGLLQHLVEDKDGRAKMLQLGAVGAIQSAMRLYSDSAAVQKSGDLTLRALWDDYLVDRPPQP